ncbi:ANTAR domain-containing protein [Blastococcus sp. SYSU DS0510]
MTGTAGQAFLAELDAVARLMAQRRCDAAEALAILSGASQRSYRKLRDIAQAIVDGAKQ